MRIAGGTDGGAIEVGGADIFCESEVEDFEATVGQNHYVGGLQVSVDDALLMGGGERIREGAADGKDAVKRQSVLGDDAVERLPVHELHGEEVDAVGLFHGVDGDDTWVVELGEGFCLATEAREALGVVRHVGGQDFEGDVASEFRVGGAVDLTHAADAKD